jgi:hypothetical protein
LEYFVAILYILWPFDKFSGYLVYFLVIWYISGHLVYIFPFLVCCSKNNLATLTPRSSSAKLIPGKKSTQAEHQHFQSWMDSPQKKKIRAQAVSNSQHLCRQLLTEWKLGY